MYINTAILYGELAENPRVFDHDGQKCCNFRLITKKEYLTTRGKRKSIKTIPVVCFGNKAEEMKTKEKGHMVMVHGEIGLYRNELNVVAEKVAFEKHADDIH